MSIGKTKIVEMQIIKESRIDIPNLGQRIKEARLASERPLRQLAREVGISYGFWYDLEKEQTAVRLETIRKMEQILGVTLYEEKDNG